MLAISSVPLLRTQRDLYEIPRGPERFRRYLDVMIGGTDDIALPLSGFNPMGQDHVASTLDALLALDAEALAERAIGEAVRRLPDLEGRLQVGLVVADDKGGGWTNRSYAEIENRFRPSSHLKRGWTVALAWTSEVPTGEKIVEEVLATIYRNLFILEHGEPRTLRQMIRQEGLAAVFAGRSEQELDPEEIHYNREVIRPHLDATDLATILPCLFGDKTAREVGNRPMGLSERAGLALAFVAGREGQITPEEALRPSASVA